jgi:hypothetical protein
MIFDKTTYKLLTTIFGQGWLFPKVIMTFLNEFLFLVHHYIKNNCKIIVTSFVKTTQWPVQKNMLQA